MRYVTFTLFFMGVICHLNMALAIGLTKGVNDGASVLVDGSERLNISPDGILTITNALVVGASSYTCDAAVEGAIRYNTTDKMIEFCDGSSWKSISAGSVDQDTEKFIFVSSGTYNANFGGLTGADSVCQSLASGAGLTGTYKALLGDSNSSLHERHTTATVPYKLVTGAVVANNWSDLMDGSIQTKVNITESGGSAPATWVRSGLAWSSTVPEQAPTEYRALSNMTCSGWTSTSGSTFLADNSKLDDQWLSVFGSGEASCSYVAPIYCLQQ